MIDGIRLRGWVVIHLRVIDGSSLISVGRCGMASHHAAAPRAVSVIHRGAAGISAARAALIGRRRRFVLMFLLRRSNPRSEYKNRAANN